MALATVLVLAVGGAGSAIGASARPDRSPHPGAQDRDASRSSAVARTEPRHWPAADASDRAEARGGRRHRSTWRARRATRLGPPNPTRPPPPQAPPRTPRAPRRPWRTPRRPPRRRPAARTRTLPSPAAARGETPPHPQPNVRYRERDSQPHRTPPPGKPERDPRRTNGRWSAPSGTQLPRQREHQGLVGRGHRLHVGKPCSASRSRTPLTRISGTEAPEVMPTVCTPSSQAGSISRA